MTDMSRMPLMAMFSVRGIGVADKVSTSTLGAISLIRSFCATPNRCSSSTMNSPRSLNFTSLDSIRWVPMRMSTSPARTRRMISSCCFAVRKRESISTFTGNPSNRRTTVL